MKQGRKGAEMFVFVVFLTLLIIKMGDGAGSLKPVETLALFLVSLKLTNKHHADLTPVGFLLWFFKIKQQKMNDG